MGNGNRKKLPEKLSVSGIPKRLIDFTETLRQFFSALGIWIWLPISVYARFLDMVLSQVDREPDGRLYLTGLRQRNKFFLELEKRIIRGNCILESTFN